jgi:uncharacterized protein (DUF58 family)
MLVLLDARGDAACGVKPDGPFEVAVCAAAALVRDGLERGEPVGLEVAGAHPLVLPAGRWGWAAAERALTLAEADGRVGASISLRAAAVRAPRPQRIVLVSAAPDAGLAAAVRDVRAAGTAVGCILCGAGGRLAGELARAGAEVATAADAADVVRALGPEEARVGTA